MTTVKEMLIRDSELIEKFIVKEKLLAFLQLPPNSNKKKPFLIAELRSRIENDKALWEQFWETFKEDLAIAPYDLEEMLGCTKVERKRWLEEGKLPVVGYREFRKGGQRLQYHVFDRRIVAEISANDIALWRKEHAARAKQNRQTGSKNAIATRLSNQSARETFASDWQQIVTEWGECGDKGIVATLQLAYWTVWASRWAKENQLKCRRAIKLSTQYQMQSQKWYELKNEAVKLLARTPYGTLSFYRPLNPNKVQVIYEDSEPSWDEDWEDEWEPAPNRKRIKTFQKDYYSLYYLQIQVEQFPDVQFSFHTPYPIGKHFLPSPKKLLKVEHEEQEGLFRFGRPLLEDEKVIHREKDVIRHFEAALKEASQVFATHPTFFHISPVTPVFG